VPIEGLVFSLGEKSKAKKMPAEASILKVKQPLRAVLNLAVI